MPIIAYIMLHLVTIVAEQQNFVRSLHNWHIKTGKQHSTNNFYSADRDLLTSTWDIVRQWKEYFAELLNQVVKPFTEEVEPGETSEEDSAITLAEVTKMVSKLIGGKTSGVVEIRLSSSSLCLCNIVWYLGTLPLNWQTRIVAPPWQSFHQGTEEENLANSKTEDSGGTLWFSS